MTPQQLYETDLTQGRIIFDAGQASIVQKLDHLCNLLTKRDEKYQTHFSMLKRKIKGSHLPKTTGLYLWGEVGSGKTYLMDLFFQALPFTQKRRLHFHEFMLEIHQQLKLFQGKSDPLHLIAKELSKQVHVLCLDEFMVNDIGDAMILSALFQGLFMQGICLIATSNTKPDDLYRNGLQRTLFLPAISHIKNHMEIVNLNSRVDYRLQTIEKRGVYFSPLNEISQNALEDYFHQFSLHENFHIEPIKIAHRFIPVIMVSHNIVWFDFDVICNSPRSQADYIEIANCFEIVIISHVHALSDEHFSQVSYFIKLIDVFYDQKVKLIMSAEVSIEELYSGVRFQQEFQRTKSRLIEMQTRQYWEK